MTLWFRRSSGPGYVAHHKSHVNYLASQPLQGTEPTLGEPWLDHVRNIWTAWLNFSGKKDFSSVSHVQLCDPIDYSMPGFPVHHQLPELTQTDVHWVGDAIQLSQPLMSPSPPAFSISQQQGLFHWVSSSPSGGQSEFQLQHQSFHRIFRTDFL